MKKSILIIALVLITGATIVFAQSSNGPGTHTAEFKIDTTKKAKPVYEYFVKVPVKDYQQLISIGGDYEKQVKYNALLSSDQKINIQLQLEKYLFDLPKSVKLDSILKK